MISEKERNWKVLPNAIMSRWVKTFRCVINWHWMLMSLVFGILSLIASCYCIVMLAVTQDVIKGEGMDSSSTSMVIASVVFSILTAMFFTMTCFIHRYSSNIPRLGSNLSGKENETSRRRQGINSTRSSYWTLKKSIFWRYHNNKKSLTSPLRERKLEIATISEEFDLLVKDMDVKVEINSPTLSRNSSEVRLSLSMSLQSFDIPNEMEDSITFATGCFCSESKISEDMSEHVLPQGFSEDNQHLCITEPESDDVVIELRSRLGSLQTTKNMKELQRINKPEAEEKVLPSQVKKSSILPDFFQGDQHYCTTGQSRQDVVVEFRSRLGSLRRTKDAKKLQGFSKIEEDKLLSGQLEEPGILNCCEGDQQSCTTLQAKQDVVVELRSSLVSFQGPMASKGLQGKKPEEEKLLSGQLEEPRIVFDFSKDGQNLCTTFENSQDVVVKLRSRLDLLQRTKNDNEQQRTKTEEELLPGQLAESRILDCSKDDQLSCTTLQASKDVVVELRNKLDSLLGVKNGKDQQRDKAAEEPRMPTCSKDVQYTFTILQASKDVSVQVNSKLGSLWENEDSRELQQRIKFEEEKLSTRCVEDLGIVSDCSKDEYSSCTIGRASQDIIVDLRGSERSSQSNKNSKELQTDKAEEVALLPGRLEDSRKALMDGNDWIRTLQQKKWMYIHHMKEVPTAKSWIFGKLYGVVEYKQSLIDIQCVVGIQPVKRWRALASEIVKI